MFHKVLHSPNLGHTIATPEAKLRLGVGLQDALHKVGAVQISTCLTGYDVIFHCLTSNVKCLTSLPIYFSSRSGRRRLVRS